MTPRSDPNPAYWEQYGPFQHVKHELVRHYLNGWYPKLGTWAGRVLSVDTHAGRGRYGSGDPGSPVLALGIPGIEWPVMDGYELAARLRERFDSTHRLR